MSDFDFDPENIEKTAFDIAVRIKEAELDYELRARHAEDWAKSRVVIANSRAWASLIVSLICLLVVTAQTVVSIQLALQQPTAINIKEPN